MFIYRTLYGTKKSVLVFAVFFALAFFAGNTAAHGAVLSLSPNSGSFTVGSTLDVSIFLNTQNQSVNVVHAVLNFPPDKLQLVSPTTGKSVIEIWTAQPVFNNQQGTVSLQGGVPGGINVSQALITRLTFRVKSVGAAMVKFSNESRVLLNDGKGTDALENTENGIYNLILPPPSGPIVVSETHPSQSTWYSNSTVVLEWEQAPLVRGYSYMLSDGPVDVPDDTSDGIKTGVAYKNVADGTHYFHIKALRNNAWGGTTHFAVNVDTSPPAEFPLDISPGVRTASKPQIISFTTTDAFSGLDHYEYKIVALSPNEGGTEGGSKPLYIEAESPQILHLALGNYDILVRAFDKAGNYEEATRRLEIVTPFFEIITGKGLRIGNIITLPWIWVWSIGALLLLVLMGIALQIRHWYQHILRRSEGKEMPDHVKNQLTELKRYRERYGKIALFLLFTASMVFGLHMNVKAQGLELTPPFVSTVSQNISNEEIFYIGGRTDAANIDVLIYLQNLQTGETLSLKATADKKGEWFYRHPTFLSMGTYLLWTQSKLGEEVSPPSPQIRMTVSPTAIQFGASRVSYETLYLIVSVILLLIILGLVLFISVHAVRGKRKHAEFLREVRDAEESIRRGFALLRRDIEGELALIKKAKFTKELSVEEKTQEEQLLRDLDSIQKYVSKEIWEFENLENREQH